MRMTKLGYFAEFLVFPVFFVVLTVFTFRDSFQPRITVWLTAVFSGVLMWTLVEYALHRFVFHYTPIMTELHDRHHRDPAALVGTPAWASLSFGMVALLSLWSVMGIGLASAVTIGLLSGYLWYVLLHYAIHHWPARRGSYLYRAKRRHAWHHHRSAAGTFGVTTDIWDWAFGTLSQAQSSNEGSLTRSNVVVPAIIHPRPADPKLVEPSGGQVEPLLPKQPRLGLLIGADSAETVRK